MAMTNVGPPSITLYAFKPVPELGLEDLSPFVSKVITYLKMQGWSFDIIPSSKHNMKGIPRGKLPFITMGDQMIPDSENIIKALEEMKPNEQRLDAKLTEEERAKALAIRRMVEESLYWNAMIHCRWIDDRQWPTTKAKYFTEVPGILKPVLSLVRRQVKNQYYAQGGGRRPAEEVVMRAKAELDSLSLLLGSKPYFMGNAWTSLDASMYGFLSHIKKDEPWYSTCPIRQVSLSHMKSKTNLCDYVERMDSRLASSSSS